MRIRLPILLATVTPALLFVGYCSYWYYAADAVRTGIDDWIVEQRTSGVGVESEGVDVGGFPLMLTPTRARWS